MWNHPLKPKESKKHQATISTKKVNNDDRRQTKQSHKRMSKQITEYHRNLNTNRHNSKVNSRRRQNRNTTWIAKVATRCQTNNR